MAMSVDQKEVIIGCGISGISAAHRLIKAGFHHVRILEVTARSGGRIKTERLGNSIVEIGASYIHGPSEENPVFCLARDYGFLDQEALSPENQAIHPGFPTGSAVQVECCGSATHSIDEIDLAGFSMYKNISGLDCTFPDGFEGLIKKLMSELPSDLVTYNRPVLCVHWNDSESGVNNVMVECDDGERIQADHVIVTVPLGYLKKHYSTLFCPSLPVHKIHSIQKLGFGTCNKIFVEFDSPWWDADCEIIYLVWKDEEDFSDQVSDISKFGIRKLSAFTVLKPFERDSYDLCGWISGHESEYMETLPEKDVRQSITELVRTFTGNPTITPRRIIRSQWFHEPWTCGSYSYPAIGCSALDLNNMMEPLPTKGSQVLFAGEATHPCYYSTTHVPFSLGGEKLIGSYLTTHPSVESQKKSFKG